jgi:hypothetical protein
LSRPFFFSVLRCDDPEFYLFYFIFGLMPGHLVVSLIAIECQKLGSGELGFDL